jgi:hypothetical protein
VSQMATCALAPAHLRPLVHTPSAEYFDIGLVGDVYTLYERLTGFCITDSAGLAHTLWRPLANTLAAIVANGIQHARAGLTITQASAPCKYSVDGADMAVLGAADPRFQSVTEDSPSTSPAHLGVIVVTL